ncbi:Serine/threonine-protein kinase PknD [compost metagenome]
MLSWGKLPVTLASGRNQLSLSLSVVVKAGGGADDLVTGPAGNDATQLGAQASFTTMREFSTQGATTSNVEVFDSNQFAYLASFGATGSMNGEFVFPDAAAADSQGNIYVADRGNHRIQKFDSNFNFVRAWGEGQIWGPESTPPPAATGSLNGWFFDPLGVTVDRDDFVWVADTGNHRILRFDSSGNFRMGIGNGNNPWYAGTNAPAPATSSVNGWFSSPHGLAQDPQGNIWVGDAVNYRLQKFNPTGTFLRGIGNGTTWVSGTAAPAPVASDAPRYFKRSYTVAIDGEGYLYATDHQNNRIQKLTPDGAFVTAWPTGGATYPLLVAPWGRLLAGSPYSGANNTIGVFSLTGERLSQFGSFGSGPAQFREIRRMNFLPDGSLLIGDYNNGRFQRFRGVDERSKNGALRLTGHRQPDTPVYALSGTYVTPAVDAGSTISWGAAYWDVESLPAGTQVAVESATSSDAVTWSAWNLVTGTSVQGKNVANLVTTTGRYLRLRLTLTTGDAACSPTVQEVGALY